MTLKYQLRFYFCQVLFPSVLVQGLQKVLDDNCSTIHLDISVLSGKHGVTSCSQPYSTSSVQLWWCIHFCTDREWRWFVVIVFARMSWLAVCQRCWRENERELCDLSTWSSFLVTAESLPNCRDSRGNRLLQVRFMLWTLSRCFLKTLATQSFHNVISHR